MQMWPGNEHVGQQEAGGGKAITVEAMGAPGLGRRVQCWLGVLAFHPRGPTPALAGRSGKLGHLSPMHLHFCLWTFEDALPGAFGASCEVSLVRGH